MVRRKTSPCPPPDTDPGDLLRFWHMPERPGTEKSGKVMLMNICEDDGSALASQAF